MLQSCPKRWDNPFDPLKGNITLREALNANESPTISAFTMSMARMKAGDQADLTVIATDKEKDPLTYKYEVVSGNVTFTAKTGTAGSGLTTITDTSGDNVTVDVISNGANIIKVTVKDDWGGEASKTLDLSGSNRSPVISSFAPLSSLIYINNSYTLNVTATDDDSDGLAYSYSITTGDKITSDITLYAQWTWRTYNLRDTGPSGGWIYYINSNAETDGWMYLEAAPEDQDGGSAITWYNGSYVETGATLTAVGTGQSNTDKIIDVQGTGIYAARKCATYSVENNGITFDDWYLPSLDELVQMGWNLYGRKYEDGTVYNPDVSTPIGGFTTGVGFFYWTSTEYGSDDAYIQPLNTGAYSYTDKSRYTGYNGNSYLIRASRSF
jgi:hypothetical protein